MLDGLMASIAASSQARVATVALPLLVQASRRNERLRMGRLGKRAARFASEGGSSMAPLKPAREIEVQIRKPTGRMQH